MSSYYFEKQEQPYTRKCDIDTTTRKKQVNLHLNTNGQWDNLLDKSNPQQQRAHKTFQQPQTARVLQPQLQSDRGQKTVRSGGQIPFRDNFVNNVSAGYSQQQFLADQKRDNNPPKVNIQSSRESEYKRQTRGLQMKDKDYYSQIDYLPGNSTHGVMQEEKPVLPKRQHQQRMRNDFNSQIDNLPGSQYNKQKEVKPDKEKQVRRFQQQSHVCNKYHDVNQPKDKYVQNWKSNNVHQQKQSQVGYTVHQDEYSYKKQSVQKKDNLQSHMKNYEVNSSQSVQKQKVKISEVNKPIPDLRKYQF